MTDYRLVFNGGFDQKSGNALRNRLAEVALQGDCESITLVFSGWGGNTDEGVSLYNFVRSLPRPIRIHAVGHVGSMAVPFFLSGHVRTCAPSSRFFFHAYTWTFSQSQVADQIVEAVQRLDNDIKLSREIVARHTTIPADTLSAIYTRTPNPVLVTPAQAVEWGIVEEIVELNPDGKVEPNVKLWTVGW